MELGRRFTRALVVATLGAGIAACGDDAPEDGDSAAITSAAADAVVDTAVDTTQNQAPVITGALNPTAIEGQLYEFTPRASDPDGDTLTFSIQGKPDWLAFDTRNGRLSGTPGGADIGSYAGIVISVSDGELGAELAPAAIDVIAASASGNSPPSISGTPADSVIVGQFYDFIPFASDPDGDSLNFEVQNLPAWADFYAPTGRLSGTPGAADVGTYGNIVISVDDGIATRTLDPFVIVVNPDPG
ncbi:MAG: putative Ig domain-containing protein, partial [Gammaproteobacteria bacterium]